jgi:hypothetical protein
MLRDARSYECYLRHSTSEAMKAVHVMGCMRDSREMNSPTEDCQFKSNIIREFGTASATTYILQEGLLQ